MGDLIGEETSLNDTSIASVHPSAQGINEVQNPNGQSLLLPKCKLPPPNALEPVANFVKEAVQLHHTTTDGNIALSTNYRALIEALRSKKDRPMLQMILLSLRTCGGGEVLNMLASSSAQHARLVHLIIRLDPFRLPDGEVTIADYDIADAQLHLMMALVSANSVFLIPILTSLWNMLSLSEGPPELTQRVHAALSTATRLCPKTKTDLFPIISANAPVRFKNEPLLSWYYKQSLQVLNYIPTLEPQIVQLLVDKALEMDVEIKISDMGEAEIDADGSSDLDQEIFEMDMDNKETNPQKALEKKNALANTSVDDMADKLDSLLFLLFEHVEQTVKNEASVSSDKYEFMERIFESSVLVTHKSKFVQFLVLHMCGLENHVLEERQTHERKEEDVAPLYRVFATRLIEIVLDPYRSIAARQTSACYLASFVSRARYVNAETCCESVSALLRWSEAYISSTQNTHAPDVRDQCSEHSLFYTVTQAAFYIMCFRCEEVLDFFRGVSNHSEAFDCDFEEINIAPKRWENVCSDQMQPLRYCLESVRVEFLEIAKVFELISAPLLQLLQDKQELAAKSRRKRKKITKIATAATLEKQRLSGGVGGLGKGTNPLDSFFPFDPYLLRRSHMFVEPYYKHWEGSVTERLVDEGSELDDENEDGCSRSNGDTEAEEENEDEDEVDDNKSIEQMATSPHFASPDVKRAQIREVWTETLKRPRIHSIASENGSW